jgi:hypothetical protein
MIRAMSSSVTSSTNPSGQMGWSPSADEPRVDGDRRLLPTTRDGVSMGHGSCLVLMICPRRHLLDMAVVAGQLAQLAVSAEVARLSPTLARNGPCRRRRLPAYRLRGAHAPGGRLGGERR